MGLTQEQLDLRTNKTKDIKAVQPREGKDFIFISYKSDDWEIVLDTIVRKLYEEYHLNVYFDNNFEKSNDSWVESMSNAITSEYCKGIIAFVSKEYMKSYACLMELMQPFTQESRAIWKHEPMGIIPVLLYELDNIGKAKEKLPDIVKPAEFVKWNNLFKDVDRRLNRDMKRNTSEKYDEMYDVLAPMMTGNTENSVKENIKLNQISNLMAVLLGGEKANCRRYSESNEGFYDNLIEAIKDLGNSSNKVEDKVFRNINPEEKDDKNSTTSSAPEGKDNEDSKISPTLKEKDINKSINDTVSLDEPEKDISYNADNHKTAVVNEITTMPSPSASANDLRSKLIEKLGGDEVKSKAVFWIKDNKKFRLRSTTSTINNNKPNEQYDYLICEIKGKYGVFSSEQESDKIAEKDLDLNFDELIEKIKEKLEEDTKNGKRICPTSEVKDDKNGTISSAPQEKDDKDITASPALKVIDDKCFAISGKALNDYKHLAEVFYKTYEKVDPKRIECFTAQMANSSEKLVWELNKQNVRSWMLTPQQNGYPYKDIPEGELLTAIETLASNFRSINKYLREIPLNYDSLFDCTGTDYELICKERDDRSKIGKGNVLVTIRGLESVSGNAELMKKYLRPSDVGFSDMLFNWTVEAELDKEYQAYLEACANKLSSKTGFLRIVEASSIPDAEKDCRSKFDIYGNAIIFDGVKFLTFSEWSEDDVEEFGVKFIEALGSDKGLKSITWKCGMGEKPVLKHIYRRTATDGEYEFLIR